LDGARVRMFNLSSAEGPQFAQYCAEFSRHIAELGPNPLSENAQAKQTSRTEPGD
jgi:F420-non-reducing hydrogenase iron-sulfur subunit